MSDKDPGPPTDNLGGCKLFTIRGLLIAGGCLTASLYSATMRHRPSNKLVHSQRDSRRVGGYATDRWLACVGQKLNEAIGDAVSTNLARHGLDDTGAAVTVPAAWGQREAAWPSGDLSEERWFRLPSPP